MLQYLGMASGSIVSAEPLPFIFVVVGAGGAEPGVIDSISSSKGVQNWLQSP